MNENKKYKIKGKWKMLPQEKGGTYQFNGHVMIMTENIQRYVSISDLIVMHAVIRQYVKKNNGADRAFTFINSSTEKKIYFYDSLTYEETKKLKGLERLLMDFYVIYLQ